jgi:hypothetical protein
MDEPRESITFDDVDTACFYVGQRSQGCRLTERSKRSMGVENGYPQSAKTWRR